MIIELHQDFRQLQLDGKSPLPRLSGNDDIEFHGYASGMNPFLRIRTIKMTMLRI